MKANKLKQFIKHNVVSLSVFTIFISFAAFCLVVLALNDGLTFKRGQEIKGIKVGDDKVFNLTAGVCQKETKEDKDVEVVNETTVTDIGEAGREEATTKTLEKSQPKIYQDCSFSGNNNIQIGRPAKVSKTNHIKPTPQQDANLVRYLEYVRTDRQRPIDELNIYYGDTNTLVNGSVGTMTPGEGYGLSKIMINPAVPEWDLPRTVAHEYVHYRWRYTLDNVVFLHNVYNDESGGNYDANNAFYHQTIADLDRIAPTVKAYRIDSNNSISSYNFNDPRVKYNETLAYACTEFSDQWLTPHLIDECNSIIDRSKMTFTY